jgi:hypothetical protein
MQNLDKSKMDLEQVLLAKKNRLLSNALDEIKRAAQKIWEDPALKGYTDHGPRHSKRVANLLGQIVDRFMETEHALSEHEVFILLAACYLHDIGMQYTWLKGRTQPLTKSDYDEIRESHPEKSFEWIKSRKIAPWSGVRVDRELDECLEPIAWVCKAHGTRFFESAVKELEGLTCYPDGFHPVRGSLLAGLMMMADELDLHTTRACFEDEHEMRFSTESQLHNLVHDYIPLVRVQDGRTPKHRDIIISFDFPAESLKIYGRDVQEWIFSKLRCQCRRTEDVLLEGSHGELTWGRITIGKEGEDTFGRRHPMPLAVQAHLREKLARRRIVNRSELKKELKRCLSSDQAMLVRIWGPEESDQRVIGNWLVTACEASVDLALVKLDLESSARDGDEVLKTIRDQLWLDYKQKALSRESHTLPSDPFLPFDQTLKGLKRQTWPSQEHRWRRALKAFIPCLSVFCGLVKPVVLCSNPDRVERWTAEELLPALSNTVPETDRGTLVILCYEGGQAPAPDTKKDQFYLGPYSKPEMEMYLMEMGYRSHTAQELVEKIEAATGNWPRGVRIYLRALGVM